MNNNTNLTEIQQNSIRAYNKEAQKKFIKEHPDYYKEQYKKQAEYRRQKAKEKYHQKKLEKEKEKENTPPMSFTDRALNAYVERMLNQVQPNLSNGNIVFICVPQVV